MQLCARLVMACRSNQQYKRTVVACSALPESIKGHRIAAMHEMLMQVPRGPPCEDASLVGPKIPCRLKEDRLFQYMRFSLAQEQWHFQGQVSIGKASLLGCPQATTVDGCYHDLDAGQRTADLVERSQQESSGCLPAGLLISTRAEMLSHQSTAQRQQTLPVLTCACCWLTSALVGATNTTRPPCCMTWLHT